MPFEPLSISVVIPTLDECETLERALACTRGEDVERIIVDAGSRDGMAEIARRLAPTTVLFAPRGRAHQLQVGFRASRGDVVLFLHADTRLEAGWPIAVRRALADPTVAGGAFALRFDSARPLYRFIEFGARLRTRLGGLPYGDQALFARRKVLEACGGIPATPIFEDLDLARAIRAQGRLALLPQVACTSPRRYEANGILRTWMRNTCALAAYGLGLERARVARWYRGGPAR